MEITSFYFLCFFTCLLFVYYITPGKFQWIILLGASICYYLLSGNGVLIIYPVIAVTLTWLLLQVLKRISEKELTKRRIVLIAELLGLFGILIGFKYTKFIGGGDLVAPLGLSFYTFILFGYFMDCYNGISEIQGNLLKTALYGMYFPVMISGPIFRIRESGEQFFKPHKLEYNNLVFGVQRMLWGFFKELVISNRLGYVVDTIFADDVNYQGAYIWVGALCFTFQLYTNFSGCMDIVIGLSEVFGIVLPENFNIPFFAKNISEYWRRWHITLGIWMKDYVFYPLLRTKLIMNLGKFLREKLGKKRGKQLTTFIAMLILWTSVGLWHGGALKYVIGCGLLHWTYIVVGELTLPFWKKLFGEKMHINLQSRGADFVRIIRTFFLVNIGNVFFRASTTVQALRMLKEGITVWNPAVLIDGSIFDLGLDGIESVVTLVSLVILFVVSHYQYRKQKELEAAGKEYDGHIVRKAIASKNIAFRWVFWFALLFYVILLGEYGPGYSAAEFIYANF